MEKQANKCLVEQKMETDCTDFVGFTRGKCEGKENCITYSCLPAGLLCERVEKCYINGFECSCQQITADLIIQAEDSLFPVDKSFILENSVILGRMINTDINYNNRNIKRFGGEDHNLSKGQIQKIHIKNFQAVDIKVLLDYMYYPKKKVNDSNVLNILHLAEEFQVCHLKNKCEKFLLRNKRHYHPLDLVNTASQYNLSDVLNCAIRMASRIPRVECYEDFDALDSSIKEQIRQRRNTNDRYDSTTYSHKHVSDRHGSECNNEVHNLNSCIKKDRQQRRKSKHLNTKRPKTEGHDVFSSLDSSSTKEKTEQRCNSETIDTDVYNNAAESLTYIIEADFDNRTINQLDNLSLDIEDEDYYADSEEGFSDESTTTEIPSEHDHQEKKCAVKSMKSRRKSLKKVFTRIINMIKD